MLQRVMSRLSVENFLSHSAEKLRRGTLRYFKKIPVAKKFMDKRGGGGGRVYHDFQAKFFCLTLPKNIIGEPFSVSLISGIEKFYASKGYVTTFCQIFFVSQCRKIS